MSLVCLRYEHCTFIVVLRILIINRATILLGIFYVMLISYGGWRSIYHWYNFLISLYIFDIFEHQTWCLNFTSQKENYYFKNSCYIMKEKYFYISALWRRVTFNLGYSLNDFEFCLYLHPFFSFLPKICPALKIQLIWIIFMTFNKLFWFNSFSLGYATGLVCYVVQLSKKKEKKMSRSGSSYQRSYQR